MKKSEIRKMIREELDAVNQLKEAPETEGRLKDNQKVTAGYNKIWSAYVQFQKLLPKELRKEYRKISGAYFDTLSDFIDNN